MTRQRRPKQSENPTEETPVADIKQKENEEESTEASHEGHEADKEVKGEPKEGDADSHLSSDVMFSFGPNGSYFLKVRDLWNFSTSREVGKSIEPSNLRQIFAASMTADGGFFMAYENQERSPAWMWTKGQVAGNNELAVQLNATHRNLFTTLSKFTNLFSLQRSSLTFGPLGSFFSRVDKEWHYSSSLPHALASKIEAKKATRTEDGVQTYPVQVALGAGGTWTVIWSDGSWSYSLVASSKIEESLSAPASSDGSESPVFVALSPYHADNFFLVRKNGMITYSTTGIDDDSAKKLSRLCNGYMQKRAKEDGTIFHDETTVGGITTKVVITPQTNFPIGWEADKSWNSKAARKVEGPPLTVMRYRTMESWRVFQASRLGRREIMIAFGAAGLGTAAACRAAGLSRRVTVAASVGAAVGTGLGCWVMSDIDERLGGK